MKKEINQWPLPCPVLGENEPVGWLGRLQKHYTNFEERGNSMSGKSVYCMAATDAEAAVIHQRLREKGFTGERITVLVRDESGGSHDFSPGARGGRPDGAGSRQPASP